jgi:hypothetical protein|tara:strand:+ start:540 stop:662 length:123 start_codon:yes stop_codon:yes gene_type:complete
VIAGIEYTYGHLQKVFRHIEDAPGKLENSYSAFAVYAIDK